MIYYSGGETPTYNDVGGYYEVYTYQQLKNITGKSSAVSVKLMEDIYICDAVLVSHNTTTTTVSQASLTSFGEQLLSFLNGVSVFDGNGKTIQYVGTQTLNATGDTFLYVLSTSNYYVKPTIKDLTIDCNNLVQGVSITVSDATLENVKIINVAENGYALTQGSSTWKVNITLDGTDGNQIESIYAPALGYIYNNSNVAFTATYKDYTNASTDITIAASGAYPEEEPNFKIYYWNTLYYNTLDDAISMQNANGSYPYFVYNKDVALLPTTTAVTSAIYILSDLSFDCTSEEYGITVGNEGELCAYDCAILVTGDGQAVLVQDGGCLNLWYAATVTGITVEKDGVLNLYGYTYMDGTQYYPSYTDLVLEEGAIVENDSDISYDVTYNGTTITIPAGETYVAVASTTTDTTTDTTTSTTTTTSTSSSTSVTVTTGVATDVATEDTTTEDTTETTTTTSTSTTSTSTTTTDTTSSSTTTETSVATATVQAEATVEDDTATVSVSDESIADAIAEAQATAAEDGSEEIAIVIEIVASEETSEEGFTSISLDISGDSVSALLDAGASEITLSTESVSLTLDSETLAVLSETLSGSIKIVATDVTGSADQTSHFSDEAAAAVDGRTVYTFAIVDESGNSLSDFGGGTVTLSIPYVLADGENADSLIVYYIDATGELVEAMPTWYDADAQLAYFTTTHFSTFALVHLAAEEAEAEDLTETGVTTDTTEAADAVTEAADGNVSLMLIAFFVILALLGGVAYFVMQKRGAIED